MSPSVWIPRWTLGSRALQKVCSAVPGADLQWSEGKSCKGRIEGYPHGRFVYFSLSFFQKYFKKWWLFRIVVLFVVLSVVLSVFRNRYILFCVTLPLKFIYLFCYILSMSYSHLFTWIHLYNVWDVDKLIYFSFLYRLFFPKAVILPWKTLQLWSMKSLASTGQ